MFENDFSEPDQPNADLDAGGTPSGDGSRDDSTSGHPLSDEFELSVGDSLIIAGQSVVVVAITDDEVTFEVADGFAFDPDAKGETSITSEEWSGAKSRPPR